MYVSTLERPVLLLEVYLHNSTAHEGSETGSGSGAGAEVGAETSLKVGSGSEKNHSGSATLLARL